ncbi:MAG: regulatory protein RecX [Oscillospiraceae bacterium]|nr:regulatory protein RecX [Oscillospiraceae bacterium]
MTVTELREIRPGHYEVKYSDGSSMKMGLAVIADFSLFTGRELSEEEFLAVSDATGLGRAKERALRIIGTRPFSERELYDKLIEKGESEYHAAAVVARFIELGLINDAEYARTLVRHYAAKGYGIRRVKDELYRHKVGRDHWEAALEEMPETDDTLDKLLASRMRGESPSDRSAVKKATDALLRRGYSWEEIRSALYRYESNFEE